MQRKVFYQVALSCVLAGTAQAFTVTPLRNDLVPGKPVTVTIDNADGKKPLTYETSFLLRHVHEDGNWDTVPDNGNDFVVIPPAGTVPPGASQTLRIMYVGEVHDRSQHYYLNVKEIPVDIDTVKTPADQAKANIRMAFAYNIGLNVASPESKSDPVLVSVLGGKKTDKGAPAVEVTIDNRGPKYAYFDALRLELETPQGTKVLGGQDLQKVANTPLLPGLSHRVLLLPVDQAFPVGPVKARLQ